MREEINVRYGHQIVSRYDDETGIRHEFVVQALDEAPEDVHNEAKRAITRNDAEMVKRLRDHRAKGSKVTWKDVGKFNDLASALASAKLRLTLMQYEDEARLALMESLTDLHSQAKSTPPPEPVPEPEPAPEPEPETTPETAPEEG